MRRKYRRISPEEAREGWTAAYDAAAHNGVGGRLSHLQLLTGATLLHMLRMLHPLHPLHLQLLTGSTLPLLTVLEALVKKFAPTLTRRDAAGALVLCRWASGCAWWGNVSNPG